MSDVIDTLAGIEPGSPLDSIRNGRLQARTHAQASYDSLFKPLTEADASKLERIAIACFVTGLHGRPEMEAFYGAALAEAGASATWKSAIVEAVKAIDPEMLVAEGVFVPAAHHPILVRLFRRCPPQGRS